MTIVLQTEGNGSTVTTEGTGSTVTTEGTGSTVNLTEHEKQVLIWIWLNEKGVTVLQEITGNEFNDATWLQKIGVLDQSDLLLSSRVVTQDYLRGNKEFKEGWFRGGAESFYKICEIVYETNGQRRRKLIAYKALHSFGDITSKMYTEAVWMAHMADQGVCPKIYAIGSGTIVKQFLEEDPVEKKLSAEDHSRLLLVILDALREAGLSPLLSALPNKKVEVIQNGRRLMLIDLGSGDISGPDALTFIQRLK